MVAERALDVALFEARLKQAGFDARRKDAAAAKKKDSAPDVRDKLAKAAEEERERLELIRAALADAKAEAASLQGPGAPVKPPRGWKKPSPKFLKQAESLCAELEAVGYDVPSLCKALAATGGGAPTRCFLGGRLFPKSVEILADVTDGVVAMLPVGIFGASPKKLKDELDL